MKHDSELQEELTPYRYDVCTMVHEGRMRHSPECPRSAQSAQEAECICGVDDLEGVFLPLEYRVRIAAMFEFAVLVAERNALLSGVLARFDDEKNGPPPNEVEAAAILRKTELQRRINDAYRRAGGNEDGLSTSLLGGPRA